ncbi:MAG: IS607 family transposase, partial [Symbiobacteriia bacterium]
MKEFLTAKDVRDRFGLNRTTLWRWEKAGKFIPAKTPGGRRRYAAADLEALLGVQKQPSGQPRCDIYCRVSTQKQSETGNLQRQKERLLAAAVDRGFQIGRVYTEVASGLNENRRELARLFRDATADPPQVLLIEFKDRLARFGFR